MTQKVTQRKKCRVCKKLKSRKEFYCNLRGRDSLETFCKLCRIARTKKNYYENLDTKKAYAREYYSEHKDYFREYRKDYYKKNRKYLLAAQKKRRLADKKRELQR